MRTQLVLGLALVTIFAVVQAQDISALLRDERVVQREINCILDNGACSGIGRHIKSLLPEVLNNNCQRCDPGQRRNARRLIYFMQTNFPNEWNIIVERYSGSNGSY